jgi:hypothetical protein
MKFVAPKCGTHGSYSAVIPSASWGSSTIEKRPTAEEFSGAIGDPSAVRGQATEVQGEPSSLRISPAFLNSSTIRSRVDGESGNPRRPKAIEIQG